jgi:hypothetical protein
VTREKTEWLEIRTFDAKLMDVPRVLLVGDSIVLGYSEEVRSILTGVATVTRFATSKCVGDPLFVEELKLALRQGEFKVVHFANGLHGLAFIDLQTYRSGLEVAVSFLRETYGEVSLVLATSTPLVVPGDPGCLRSPANETVIERNAVLCDLAAAASVPVNDLYATVRAAGAIYAPDGTHLSEGGSSMLAQRVSEIVSALLDSRLRGEGSL